MPGKRHKRRRIKASRPTLTVWQRAVHIAAWLLCGVTFPLLWLGGLVTTTKSGMAVPDWPGTYGYNLLLYPLSTWWSAPWDLFVEHGHRLLASLAGLLTIVLMLLIRSYDPRAWMRVVGILALAAVIAQGVLGGLRVLLNERLLAMVHGATGPLFFALTVAMVVWTSNWWLNTNRDAAHRAIGSSTPFLFTLLILVYVQMVVGALVRHMPITASPLSFAGVAKAHLFLAGLVTLFVSIASWRLLRSDTTRGLRIGGAALAGLILVQLGLGLTTWLAKYGVPVALRAYLPPVRTAWLANGWWQSHIVTAHQATGSLLLAVTLLVAMLAWRVVPLPALTSNPETMPTGDHAPA